MNMTCGPFIELGSGQSCPHCDCSPPVAAATGSDCSRNGVWQCDTTVVWYLADGTDGLGRPMRLTSVCIWPLKIATQRTVALRQEKKNKN
jgi:hypothetical protein